MTMTARDYLTRGHRWGEVVHEREHRRMLAGLFRSDERCERLLRLKASDPAVFAALGAGARISIGHYSETKDAFVAEQGEAT
jgi:hypothetical protein